ncbi:cytoplasmic superoxide dismutase [Culex quinquefasciatus]|uniref:Cytoplasmic superoxide dismutase n=1 Tax=Culex quinquefasciatus TaxID=7176 RepID=B0XHE6_CULQU|nr:cytoplasmic superoxide dismutase [Culex quinquefasciatus]|eukprot:XP_001869068.1 cytoplasmic superoxide dismutase [Culex quinquefasciatus]
MGSFRKSRYAFCLFSTQVMACPDQNPLEATMGLVPLFETDMYEHAYYLLSKNLRPN